MRMKMLVGIIILLIVTISPTTMTCNAFICNQKVMINYNNPNEPSSRSYMRNTSPKSRARTSTTRISADVANDDNIISTMPTKTHEKPKETKKVVIIGGGWAGYTTAESLSQSLDLSNSDEVKLEITLLDASAKGGGGLAGGYRNEKSNRPAEAGIHGFWREYKNTFDVMDNIEGVEIEEVLGDWSPSVLFSKNGRVALAPVLGNEGDDDDSDKDPSANLNFSSIRKNIAANLPPPLDLPILAEFEKGTSMNANSKLKPIDLISAIGLLGAWADFEQESPSSWKRYDSFPATALFQQSGITETLMEELVSPLLHVLPMCPAYDCSAAAALSCFHVFALQSRGAFDVKWCTGSISEKIFGPWRTQLENRGVVISGGKKVTSIEQRKDEDGQSQPKYTIWLDGDDSAMHCDAIVLAVGATSMSKVAAASPVLSSLPSTKDFDKLRGITCVAVRLFLKPHSTITSNLKGGVSGKTQLPPDMAEAMVDSPVAVCGAGIGGIKELKETGFCIYDLQRMHHEFIVDRYDSVADEPISVLEIDFYRADDIANMDDDKIANLALEAVSQALGTKKIDPTSQIVDKAILRARNAVSHFAPNSASYSPSVKLEKGLYLCGDWIDRTGHASWSTEKSVVTARQAAAALCGDFGLDNSAMRTKCKVIPAANDTFQLDALRQSTKVLRAIAPPRTVPPSPWVLAKQLFSV